MISWCSIIPAAELQSAEEKSNPALRSIWWSRHLFVMKSVENSCTMLNSSVHGKMTTFSQTKTPSKPTQFYIYMHVYISNQPKNLHKKPSKPRPGVNKLWPKKAFLGLGTRTPARVISWSQWTWELPTYNSRSKKEKVATQNKQNKYGMWITHRKNWCKLNKYILYIYICTQKM